MSELTKEQYNRLSEALSKFDAAECCLEQERSGLAKAEANKEKAEAVIVALWDECGEVLPEIVEYYGRVIKVKLLGDAYRVESVVASGLWDLKPKDVEGDGEVSQ